MRAESTEKPISDAEVIAKAEGNGCRVIGMARVRGPQARMYVRDLGGLHGAPVTLSGGPRRPAGR